MVTWCIVQFSVKVMELKRSDERCHSKKLQSAIHPEHHFTIRVHVAMTISTAVRGNIAYMITLAASACSGHLQLLTPCPEFSKFL